MLTRHQARARKDHANVDNDAKRQRRVTSNIEQPTLSSLPDSLLCHIASHLQANKLSAWLSVNQRLHSLDCFRDVAGVYFGSSLLKQLRGAVDERVSYETLLIQHVTARKERGDEVEVESCNSFDEYAFMLEVHFTEDIKKFLVQLQFCEPCNDQSSSFEIVFCDDDLDRLAVSGGAVAKGYIPNPFGYKFEGCLSKISLFISNRKNGKTKLFLEVCDPECEDVENEDTGVLWFESSTIDYCTPFDGRLYSYDHWKKNGPYFLGRVCAFVQVRVQGDNTLQLVLKKVCVYPEVFIQNSGLGPSDLTQSQLFFVLDSFVR